MPVRSILSGAYCPEHEELGRLASSAAIVSEFLFFSLFLDYILNCTRSCQCIKEN